MGKTVVFTDKEELTKKEIVEMYDSRNMIEDDIKWLNGTFHFKNKGIGILIN
jgi:transposase